MPPLVSPLRYPGGKASLLSLIGKIIRGSGLSIDSYVEPYAGGAGLACALLATGEVETIWINDKDPRIYAFWKSVVDDNEHFLQRLQDTPVTIDEWRRQKEVYRAGFQGDWFELGFSTFFLNRTNRSGVLNAGPIGGQNQMGSYLIDARFNKRDLMERIRVLGVLQKRIHVTCEDGRSVIEAATGRRVLVYADPPYYHKSGSLYMNKFTHQDHKLLAQQLIEKRRSPWLLSYDDTPEIAALYDGIQRLRVGLEYSVRTRSRTEELFYGSDAIHLTDVE